MAEVRETISIGSRADTRGFKKAESASAKLTRSIRNLAGAFGVAFSTTQILNFGKSSVKAFAEMQAEQDRLTRLMKVGTGASAAQIQALNNQASALENLGVVTKGNITQVQSQLATFNLQADTISKLTPAILDYVTAEKGAAASTEQFKSMTNGLAQALNGNFTSLTRVGFVFDQTTKDLIKNGTEAERTAAIVKVLDSTYKGFNASLRDTPIGQMQLLAASAENAREIIGEGLVDAMALVGGQGTKDIEKATTMMEDLARATADVIRGEAVILSNLGSLGGGTVGKIGQGILLYFKEITGIQARQDLGRATRPDNRAGRFFRGGAQGTLFDKAASDAAKLEKQRLALAKKQLEATKKLTAEQKKQAALKKAGTVFDLDQIELVAALQGRLSKDEENRIKAQLALLNGNVKVAEELTEKVLKAQDASGDLARFLAALPNARNPFGYLDAYLDKLAAKAAKVLVTAPAQTISPQAQAIVSQIDAATSQALAAAAAAEAEANRISSINKALGTLPSASGVPIGQPFSPGFSAGGNNTPGASFELKITGEGDITNAIAKGLQNQSLSTGRTTTINRSGGFL
jgi:hypothetical protein